MADSLKKTKPFDFFLEITTLIWIAYLVSDLFIFTGLIIEKQKLGIFILVTVGTLFSVGLGTFLNRVAVRCNGGKMPVLRIALRKNSYLLDDGHYFMEKQSRLKILCDIFPFPYNAVISIGDIIIFLGPLLGTLYNISWLADLWLQMINKYVILT